MTGVQTCALPIYVPSGLGVLRWTVVAAQPPGIGRVSNRVHTIATFLVAFGTSMSAFWILALNSWMQTPAGFEMRINAKGDLVAYATDWWAVIFNPSFPYKYAHMMTACFVTTAFLLAGLSAYQYLRGSRSAATLTTLKTGVFMAALLLPVQIALGDLHGLATLRHQPAKLAAMEGIWKTQKDVPAILFALPDQATKSNRFEIAIPNLASLYLTHGIHGEVKGLNEFEGKHPPVAPVFWAFRIMVGMGMLMLAVAWLATWQFKRRGLPAPWMIRILVGMSFAGWVATLSGWYVTEIGRQPYLVTGILTTAQAAATTPAPMVATTLVMYLALYGGLLAAYISVVFHMARKQG